MSDLTQYVLRRNCRAPVGRFNSRQSTPPRTAFAFFTSSSVCARSPGLTISIMSGPWTKPSRRMRRNRAGKSTLPVPGVKATLSAAEQIFDRHAGDQSGRRGNIFDRVDLAFGVVVDIAPGGMRLS